MARGDFIRQMPESSRDFGRKPTLYERLHIDVPLLGILFALCVYGLVVLYSASGRQIDAVLRQGGFMAIGFAAMLSLAQLNAQGLEDFALELLESESVLIVPGTGFNIRERNHFRLTLLPQPAEIDDVFSRIDRCLSAHT